MDLHIVYLIEIFAWKLELEWNLFANVTRWWLFFNTWFNSQCVVIGLCYTHTTNEHWQHYYIEWIVLLASHEI